MLFSSNKPITLVLFDPPNKCYPYIEIYNKNYTKSNIKIEYH